MKNQYGLLEKDSIIFDNSNKDVIKLIKPEVIKLKNCLIDELKGTIKASENSGLINIEQTEEKRVGILKLLF